MAALTKVGALLLVNQDMIEAYPSRATLRSLGT